MGNTAPDGGEDRGGSGVCLRRWHGYAAAQLTALVAWALGASAPDMHSDADLLPTPMLDFALILALALVFLPAILVGVVEAVVLGRAGGRTSQQWAGLLCGFGFLIGALAVAAVRLLGDFDLSDGFAFHRLTWLGSLLGMEIGLGLEILVGLASYPSFLRRDGV